MPRNLQRITVAVSLVGLQDTAVAAHRPGTDGAAVSVRVGTALLYVHDAPTAQAFFRTWRLATRKARSLPPQANPTKVASMAGRSEPAVMLNAADIPPTWSQFDQARRRLQICMGRILFEVNDHEALRSTLGAFRRADQLAQTTFATPTMDPAQQAAQAANRLLTPPEGSREARAPRRSRPEAVATARHLPAVRTTVDGLSR